MDIRVPRSSSYLASLALEDPIDYNRGIGIDPLLYYSILTYFA